MERNMRQVVVRMLTDSGLDAVSVENSAGPGTPDVNFREGWIELKYLKQWPDGPDTDVRIDCFTPQQRVWILRRWMSGGAVFLLLQVGRDWLLFNGDDAALRLAKPGMSRNKTECLARVLSQSKEDILPILIKGRRV
jgi:hypothetical protein